MHRSTGTTRPHSHDVAVGIDAKHNPRTVLGRPVFVRGGRRGRRRGASYELIGRAVELPPRARGYEHRVPDGQVRTLDPGAIDVVISVVPDRPKPIAEPRIVGRTGYGGSGRSVIGIDEANVSGGGCSRTTAMQGQYRRHRERASHQLAAGAVTCTGILRLFSQRFALKEKSLRAPLAGTYRSLLLVASLVGRGAICVISLRGRWTKTPCRTVLYVAAIIAPGRIYTSYSCSW